MYKFQPTFKTVGLMPDFSEDVIKVEPMFFSSTKQFALTHSGLITKTFIEIFLNDYDDWIIDSRVHMLKRGWFPCMPGWHHDDIPLDPKTNQPNYDTPEYFARHRFCVIGQSSMTEFLNCETEMPKVDTIFYKDWNDVIKAKYLDTTSIFKVSSGDVVDFTWQDFHRGVECTVEFCWRYFIRASRQTKREFKNEIRNQVQIYLVNPETGW